MQAERWWEPYKQVGEVRLTHVDLRSPERHRAAALALLNERDRARWRRLRNEAARKRFILCRAALRVLLCEELGCANADLSFWWNRHGKPFAVARGHPAPVSFSVSHSRGHGLIALAPRGRIGVDIEERRRPRDFEMLARGVLGANEQAALEAMRSDRRTHVFWVLWTLKEALGKALGTGLNYEVNRFELPAPMRSGTARCTFTIPDFPDIAWRLDNIGNNRFAAAVAQEALPGNLATAP